MIFPAELPPIDDNRIRELWLSAFLFPTVSIADELGLFDFLAKQQSDVKTLAAAIHLSIPKTEALTTTLSALGLLVRHDALLQLTALSRHYLVSHSPFYWGHMFKLYREIPVTHGSVLDALQEKESLEQVAIDDWEAGQMPVERANIITAAMHSHSIAPAVALAKQLDLSTLKSMLDVAGGSGCYALALAQANPGIRFDVADLPPVCANARQNIASFDMSSRIGTVEFNMFTSPWPRTYDAMFFANVLHDWNETQRVYLVQQCFDALPAGGEILIFEMLINETGDDHLAASLMWMNMLLLTKGKQFTVTELTSLLKSCGFEEPTTQQIFAGYGLMRARKP